MHKDFIHEASHHDSEAGFVEAFWTENWKRAGGVENRAHHFAKTIRRFRWKSEWRIMEPYFRKLPEGAVIVDGGCGTGEWCRFLTESGYPTIGVDISRETIEELRKLFPNDRFEAGDIRHLDFESNSVDVYYSWGTFEHFEIGINDCVAEAHRILKPGGMLFITVPFDHVFLALSRTFGSPKGRARQDDERFYQWRFTRSEISRELRLMGFDVENMLPIHRRQSIVRALHRGFGINYNNPIARGLGISVGAISPRMMSGHMLMVAARKPFENKV